MKLISLLKKSVFTYLPGDSLWFTVGKYVSSTDRENVITSEDRE